ncbi:MAG: hypothetical protein DME22_06390 [Verrucomicrobia bacterium]|nr:MAG: hypothetical protein DME22_06390 [Verrucomicrobiota bacterium]
MRRNEAFLKCVVSVQFNYIQSRASESRRILLFILKFRGQQIDVVSAQPSGVNSPSVFRFVEKRRSIVALSGCGRIRRTVGSAVSVGLSVEPIALRFRLLPGF